MYKKKIAYRALTIAKESFILESGIQRDWKSISSSFIKVRLSVIGLVFLLLGVMVGANAAAQQCNRGASIMTGKILTKAAQALGGKRRLERLASIRIRSEIETAGLKGVSEEWQLANGQRKESVDLGSVYKSTTIFNGKGGWTIDQDGYVSDLTGANLKGQILSAYLASYSYLVPGRISGCVAEASEDQSRQFYVLRMAPRGGQPVTLYLDKTTYLPVRQEAEKKGQTYTTFFSDWREVNGLKVPFKLRETTGDPRNETITTILEAHFNIPLSAKIFAKPQQTTAGVLFTQGRSASHIPFELFNNEILFEMRVNNSAPLLALFDTGASISLIDSQRANSLGLNSQGELGASAQGGTVSVALINGVTFNFPGARISDRTVASTSLEPIEEGLGRKIDLVLGSDVIKRFVVEVDYANKLLKLHDPRRYRYTGRGQSIPLTIDKIPFVSAKIATAQGTFVEGRFLIDTGADGTVELNRPFVEANRLLNNQKTIEASGAGLGGTQKTLVGRAKALQLGGFNLNNILVTFLQDSEGAGADSDSAGLIGSEILGRFKVIFNYQRQQMILERNARFNEPYDRDMSGVELKSVDLSPKAFQITKVVKDSPADRAGLQEGDFIISIDGKDAALFDLNAINKMFKREGLDISLAIRRGEKALEVRLKLKRMI